MFRIYFYKKDAIVVKEGGKESYFISPEKAAQMGGAKMGL